ncbi:MAG: GTP cyclohydrolase I [bacterium]|nr:GTP cyclohydrolase I [bacterium]
MNKPKSSETATRILTSLLQEILPRYGENPEREGLLETPRRIIAMYSELLSGYGQDPKDLFKTFEADGYTGTVLVSQIDFYSICEHHMLPFFGTVDIKYTPKDKVLGLSKFARVVEVFSRRLQTQENMTNKIFEAISENLKPLDLTVTVRGEHLCMSIRGVKRRGAVMETTVSSMSKISNEVNQSKTSGDK